MKLLASISITLGCVISGCALVGLLLGIYPAGSGAAPTNIITRDRVSMPSPPAALEAPALDGMARVPFATNGAARPDYAVLAYIDNGRPVFEASHQFGQDGCPTNFTVTTVLAPSVRFDGGVYTITFAR